MWGTPLGERTQAEITRLTKRKNKPTTPDSRGSDRLTASRGHGGAGSQSLGASDRLEAKRAPSAPSQIHADSADSADSSLEVAPELEVKLNAQDEERRLVLEAGRELTKRKGSFVLDDLLEYLHGKVETDKLWKYMRQFVRDDMADHLTQGGWRIQ